MYIYTLTLTSALDGGVGGQRNASAALPQGKRPGTHFIGGWLGPRAGLGGCGKSRPHRDWIPGPRKVSPLPGLDPRTVQPVGSTIANEETPIC